MKKIKRSILILSLVFMSLIVFTCGSDKESKEKQTAVPIRVVDVEMKKLSIPIHTSGKITSVKESKLSFKVGGILKKIFVDEGQSVTKGELLAELDLIEINAKVLQAKNGYEKAKRDYERIKNLYADSVASLEQLQNTETAFNIAQSNLQIAEFNFTHSKIHAPSNGKILKKLAEENELANGGFPVFVFGSSGKDWIMRVGVTDKDIVKLNLGASAKISVDAYPGDSINAIISEVGETANPYNGTYEVELIISNDNKKLKSGFVAKADIYPSEQEKYFIIPIEAIVEAGQSEGTVFVYDLDKKTVSKRLIEIGHIYEDKIAVTKGLSAGESIVIEGASYLSNESIVKLIEN